MPRFLKGCEVRSMSIEYCLVKVCILPICDVSNHTSVGVAECDTCDISLYGQYNSSKTSRDTFDAVRTMPEAARAFQYEFSDSQHMFKNVSGPFLVSFDNIYSKRTNAMKGCNGIQLTCQDMLTSIMYILSVCVAI